MAPMRRDPANGYQLALWQKPPDSALQGRTARRKHLRQ